VRFQVIDAGGFEAALAAEGRPFVLDVRTLEAYEAGHVPGSHNVPVHDLGRRMRELPQSKAARILVVGDEGRRTAAAGNWLALMGYVDVAALDGGIAAFRGELEKGPPPPPPARGPELRVVP
jgi:rhodanese-related sulfurtransferase